LLHGRFYPVIVVLFKNTKICREGQEKKKKIIFHLKKKPTPEKRV